ncbi:MAG TPA: nucleotidyltransferase family protein [Gemmatimonadaceae bacterium]|nr:nucleotidyltransferase family protein [Gemmatimonadaceae bacterium]
MIAALLLAAGGARRFGGQKLLEVLEGRPIIRCVAEALVAGSIERVLVVVPPGDRVIGPALAGLHVEWIVNPEPERGIGSSIAAGVRALPADIEAVAIALADEPHLPPATVRAVLDAYRVARPRVVAPFYSRGAERVPGHPVLFDRGVFAELVELNDDRGARAVVTRDAARVMEIAVAGTPPVDVDTPRDLARARQERQNMASSPSTPPHDP